MSNLKALNYAHYVIRDLRKNLKCIAKLHIHEIDQQVYLTSQTSDSIKQQMHMLAIVIQNLTHLYGDHNEI